MGKKKNGWINRYYHNKFVEIGEIIECPICRQKFQKTTAEHTFCRIYCKNEFWKRVRSNNGYYTEYNQRNPERYFGLVGLGFRSDEREDNLRRAVYGIEKSLNLPNFLSQKLAQFK